MKALNQPMTPIKSNRTLCRDMIRKLRKSGKFVFPFTVGVLFSVSLTIATWADEKAKTGDSKDGEASSTASSADEIDVTAMTDLTVVLRDERGEPISGAEVMPYAMRMREQQGHGFWDRKVYGPPKRAQSNKQGEAVIQYPSHVRDEPNILTTSLVTFVVKHAEFVTKTVNFNLGPEKAEVTLQEGCEAEISAVDSDRKPIENFGVLMAGPYAPEFWIAGEGGTRRSGAIREGTWQTMLVKQQKDGPTLFSSVVPLQVRPDQRVRFQNFSMRSGTKVHGVLSDNVPRPVKGYVVATSVPLPAGDSWSEKDPSLAWHDWVEVRQDGSFEFESLPRSGTLQLIAICEGWLSTTISDDPAAGNLVVGQVFEIDGDEHSVVVEMEPTGTLEVSLVTEDEKPITGGQVSSWPNQHYLKGGNTLLGQRFRSALQIQNQLAPIEKRIDHPDLDMQFPFIQDVGPDGTATLKGLPVGYRGSLYLTHQHFVLEAGGQRGEIQYTLDSVEPVSQKLVVIPAK